MGGFHHSNEETYEQQVDGLVPLTAATRAVVVVAHYLAIPCLTLVVYAFVTKIHRLEGRIYSPFFLLTAVTWLLMATSFEIGNHFYVDNWQLYNPQADLINGSFFFFNFGAQNLLAMGLRRKTIPKGSDSTIVQWKTLAPLGIDSILAILIIVNPIVYGVAGRSTAVSALSPLASLAGIVIFWRTWRNLGPNWYTLVGGVGFLVFVLLGVGMLAVYRATQVEWVHALIGGSFVVSTLPLALAIWNVQEIEEPMEEGNGKEEDAVINANNDQVVDEENSEQEIDVGLFSD